jgi:uncharacterized membrane protein YkvA (DUF1232 family)
VTLWFASRREDVPVAVKFLCVFVAAYALSPIDLIPDFVPVLGYLDDLVLLPALILLAIRLLPVSVLQASRERADEWIAAQGKRPKSYVAAAVIVAVWALVAWGVFAWWRS